MCFLGRGTHITRDMCFRSGGTHTNRDMCILGRETQITRDMCFLSSGTHITSDLCFLGRETHITRGMCFLGRGTNISSDITRDMRSSQTPCLVLPPGFFCRLLSLILLLCELFLTTLLIAPAGISPRRRNPEEAL